MIDATAPTVSHSLTVTPGPKGADVVCACGFRALGRLFGEHQAIRLGHAHIAYPTCSTEELMLGPVRAAS